MDTFGETLKDAVAAAGYSGNRFAERVGSSQATVSRVFRGKAGIPDGKDAAWYEALEPELVKRGLAFDAFCSLSDELRAEQHQRSGPNRARLSARARRAEAALLSLAKACEKGGLKLPESVRQTVESIRKERRT